MNLFNQFFKKVSGLYFIVSLLLVIYSTSASGKIDKEAPVIFRVSEGIAPGKTVSIYGEYLTGTVKVKFIGKNGILLGNTTYSPVQQDKKGQFLRVILPVDASPGVYAIYVSNENGWCKKPAYLNNPDPRWLTDTEAWPGMTLRILGRNLDASEYKGIQKTEIKLVAANRKETILQPFFVTPLRLEFIVPLAVSKGDYKIWVRTNADGMGDKWIAVRDYPNETSVNLKISEVPVDPLSKELGVSWANEFNYSRVIDVKNDFGAKGDDVSDDTESLQRAVDKAAANGGGIVYLPNGTYKYTGLYIDKGVILKGENNVKTILKFYGKRSTIIESKNRGNSEGCIGFANIKFTRDYTYRTSEINAFYLGFHDKKGIWNKPANISDLTARNFFIFNCNIDYSDNLAFRADSSYGPHVFAKSNVLIAKCNWKDHTPPWIMVINSGYTVRDNVFEYCSNNLESSADKFLFINNKLIGHYIPKVTDNLHGVFHDIYSGAEGHNAFNAYFGNNEIRDLNYVAGNDAEGVSLDGSAGLLNGKVISSGKRSVTVSEDQLPGLELFGQDPNSDFDPWSMEFSVLIVKGKGLGQMKTLVSHTKIEGSPNQYILKLSSDWDIQPDTSSVVAVSRWHNNVVIEGNRFSNNCNTSTQFFFAAYDCVSVGNTSVNTGGFDIWGNGYNVGECYFNQIKRNKHEGFDIRHQDAWCGIRGYDRSPSIQYDQPPSVNKKLNHRNVNNIAVYGTEIRDNIMNRAGIPENTQMWSAGGASFVVHVPEDSIITGYANILATLLEGNTALNGEKGISVSHESVYGTFLRNNKYKNVKIPVEDLGIGTVIIEDEKFDSTVLSDQPETSTFTDPRDGKIYKTVKIGGQWLMSENFAFKPGNGKYWPYNNDVKNVAKYGYLYDWETARTIVPKGWHLPTKAEWEKLYHSLGDSPKEVFVKMILGGSSGFNARYGGWHNSSGLFCFINKHAIFWSNTEISDSETWYFNIYSQFGLSNLYDNRHELGLSVRLFRDN